MSKEELFRQGENLESPHTEETVERRGLWSMIFHHVGHFVVRSRFNQEGKYDGAEHLSKATELLNQWKSGITDARAQEIVRELSRKLAACNFDDKRDEALLGEITETLNELNSIKSSM